MDDLVQVTQLSIASSQRAVECSQIATGHYNSYPTLGANHTGKSLNSLQSIYVLGQVRIPNRDSMFKMRMDQSCIQLFQHFNARISINPVVEYTNLLTGFRAD